MLNENVKAFVVHVTSFSLSKPRMSIYPVKETQIVSLFTKEIKIPAEYSDFSNVFSEKKVLILLKITNLNSYAIKL